jgi:SulP family sulfate permease
VRLHLAEVKGPVMDRLKQSVLLQRLSGQVFLSTANAWNALSAKDE